MYGYTAHIPAPAEAYHAMHQAVMDVVGEEGGSEGLVVHLACATDRGVDVTEVWTSKEELDAFNKTVLPKAMARAGVPLDGPLPQTEELDVIGLVVPRPVTSDATA